jgi:DNA-binding NtrC family response regulator
MSTTHARFLNTAEGWVLEDARSTNGSFVNGEPVERAHLQEGDIVELGHTIFSLRVALPTPAGTSPLVDSAVTPTRDPGFATLVPALFEEFERLARFSESQLPMLLLGETGTGKEVVARALHRLSKRQGPFVAVNCGALPANLVEGQLFGHKKGAFSGAHRDEPGLIRSADGGTLLLDEIGDLPMAAQPALLRVLQENEVIPVGGVQPIGVDVRVLAATHRPLEKLADDDRFRKDLFARLDGYRCRLPNLRDRREDLGIIAAEFLRAQEPRSGLRLTPAAGLALAMHDWPFNVRELVQRLKRAQVLAQGAMITEAHLSLVESASGEGASSSSRAGSATPLTAGDQNLKRELLVKLEEHGGNVAEVARSMGKARMQIHRWVKRFGIEIASFRR